jgi:hypothetical protein
MAIYMGSSYDLLGVLIFVLDIIAIVSLLGGSSSIERKLIWVVVILLLPLLGMLLYFLLGRSSRDA